MADNGLDSARVYTDMGGLSTLKNKAKSNDPEALKAVGKEFESLFLQMTMKSMREASKPTQSEQIHSDHMETYQDLMDKQVAQELSRTGQLGVAKFLSRAVGKMPGQSGPGRAGPTNGQPPGQLPGTNAQGDPAAGAEIGAQAAMPLVRPWGIPLAPRSRTLRPLPGTVAMPLKPLVRTDHPDGIPLHKRTVRPLMSSGSVPLPQAAPPALQSSPSPPRQPLSQSYTFPSNGIASNPSAPPAVPVAASQISHNGQDPLQRQAIRQRLAASDLDGDLGAPVTVIAVASSSVPMSASSTPRPMLSREAGLGDPQQGMVQGPSAMRRSPANAAAHEVAHHRTSSFRGAEGGGLGRPLSADGSRAATVVAQPIISARPELARAAGNISPPNPWMDPDPGTRRVSSSPDPLPASRYGQDPPLRSPADFVEQMRPHAIAAAKELGVHPDVLLAQAALETGWGQHTIREEGGGNSYNLFGIKADERWLGTAVSSSTHEYEGGDPHTEVALFRSYENYADSFRDYVDFIKSQPRYSAALQNAADPQAYVQALQQAGYATDPAYADKIMRVMNSDPILAPHFTNTFSAGSVRTYDFSGS